MVLVCSCMCGTLYSVEQKLGDRTKWTIYLHSCVLSLHSTMTGPWMRLLIIILLPWALQIIFLCIKFMSAFSSYIETNGTQHFQISATYEYANSNTMQYLRNLSRPQTNRVVPCIKTNTPTVIIPTDKEGLKRFSNFFMVH